MRKAETWDSVRVLCDQVEDDVDALVDATARHIRRLVPAYAGIAAAEHRTGIRQQFAGVLAALADARDPTPEELDRARQLGRRRANQGLPVQAVIEAFQIGYLHLWEALLARAPEATPELLRAAGVMWRWIHGAASAVAEGHTDAVRAIQVGQTSLRHRFLLALHLAAAADTDQTAIELAEALGYDAHGTFQALCTPADAAVTGQLDRIQTGLDAAPGTAHCAQRGGLVVVMTQETPLAPVVDVLHTTLGGGPVGIGMPRLALAGAETSIGDAERALLLADATNPVVAFDEQWLLATLGEGRVRLDPLVRGETAAAREHPHLADAVVAYARCGFSTARAARELCIHPNSATYRLDRWQHLTGHDPRTLDGLLRALIAISTPPRGIG